MINKFPLWKNLLIAVIILLGFFYALPNLYGEDPALQISGTHGIEVDSTVSSQVQTLLDGKNIKGDYELENGQLLIRFANTNDQILAKDIVAKALGDRFITALNLAPATPAWMRSLGMHPLKLGLDLRGGVHFLRLSRGAPEHFKLGHDGLVLVVVGGNVLLHVCVGKALEALLALGGAGLDNDLVSGVVPAGLLERLVLVGTEAAGSFLKLLGHLDGAGLVVDGQVSHGNNLLFINIFCFFRALFPCSLWSYYTSGGRG